MGENTRRDIILSMEEMGYVITSSHHEIAPAQHEIDFTYENALATADKIMTFKTAVGTIAKIRTSRHIYAEAPHGRKRFRHAS